MDVNKTLSRAYRIQPPSIQPIVVLYGQPLTLTNAIDNDLLVCFRMAIKHAPIIQKALRQAPQDIPDGVFAAGIF